MQYIVAMKLKQQYMANPWPPTYFSNQITSTAGMILDKYLAAL